MPIKGYEGLYEVSNLGKIRSLDKYIKPRNGKLYLKKVRVLKQCKNNQGYYTVQLCKNGAKTFKVHTVVAYSFLGDRPKGLEVLHGVLGKEVNFVTNLKYGTRKENERDKVRDKTSNHILPAEKILEIRKIYNEGELTIYQLSKLYELDPSRIRKIVLNISYKHIK